MITVELENVERAIRDLNSFDARKVGAVSFIIEATAFRVLSNAKQDVRVDTGYLQDNIVLDMPDTLTAEVGTDVFYGPYVEARYPYLAPAWHREIEPFIRDIRAELSKP